MSHSLCAVHPERESTGICERCGAFGCAECLAVVSERRLCTACRALASAGLPSLKGRASLAGPAIWATTVAGLLVSLVGFGFNPDAADETAEVAPEFVARALALGCLGVLYLAIFITTIVLFCRWFHLLVRHATARGIPVQSTPAGAVGSFFIPFVNLVKPFEITKQIAAGGKGVALAGQWQAMWIIANIASNIGARLDTLGTAGDVVSLLGALLMFGAASTCTRVITELTQVTEVR